MMVRDVVGTADSSLRCEQGHAKFSHTSTLDPSSHDTTKTGVPYSRPSCTLTASAVHAHSRTVRLETLMVDLRTDVGWGVEGGKVVLVVGGLVVLVVGGLVVLVVGAIVVLVLVVGARVVLVVGAIVVLVVGAGVVLELVVGAMVLVVESKFLHCILESELQLQFKSSIPHVYP